MPNVKKARAGYHPAPRRDTDEASYLAKLAAEFGIDRDLLAARVHFFRTGRHD